MIAKLGFGSVLLIAFSGCRERSASATEPGGSAETPSASASELTEAGARPSVPKAPPIGAQIGQPAPDFELLDLDGKKFRLAALKGKVVVLEWFNPECPFVRAAHTKGSLVDVGARLQKSGVVYLAVNSGGPGRQGHGIEANRSGVVELQIQHPVLLDETGKVGRRYGATNTPHAFVIDARGVLVYRGAVDNSPDGEGESPEGAQLVRFMEDAALATIAGNPVSIPETKAYGCSVKYAP